MRERFADFCKSPMTIRYCDFCQKASCTENPVNEGNVMVRMVKLDSCRNCSQKLEDIWRNKEWKSE